MYISCFSVFNDTRLSVISLCALSIGRVLLLLCFYFKLLFVLQETGFTKLIVLLATFTEGNKPVQFFFYIIIIDLL